MTVKQVQNLLQYMGYYKDIPDDLYGPKTLEAITKFQSVYEKMGIDGIYSPQLEAALLDAVATGQYFNPEPEKTPELEVDEVWPSKHFRREDFRCKCGGRYCNGFPVEPDKQLLLAMDEFYERLGVHVWIGGSGLRCRQHNANTKGASPNSQHLYGLAADLYSSQSPEEMYRVAEEVLGDSGGLGLYKWGIHFDTRAGKSRWDSR
jgi:peptidoglycan hydrolase-like protein with peptidoglycan-binding domain